MTPETPTRPPFDPRQFLEATARASRLEFQPGALDAAAAELADAVERDEHGKLVYSPAGYASAFRIESGAVIEVPVGETVSALIVRHTKPVAPPAPAPETPRTPARSASSVPSWARTGTDVLSQITRADAERHAARMAELTATYQNPWRTGQINRTHQSHIDKYNPALAAKYKAEAGV